METLPALRLLVSQLLAGSQTTAGSDCVALSSLRASVAHQNRVTTVQVLMQSLVQARVIQGPARVLARRRGRARSGVRHAEPLQRGADAVAHVRFLLQRPVRADVAPVLRHPVPRVLRALGDVRVAAFQATSSSETAFFAHKHGYFCVRPNVKGSVHSMCCAVHNTLHGVRHLSTAG